MRARENYLFPGPETQSAGVPRPRGPGRFGCRLRKGRTLIRWNLRVESSDLIVHILEQSLDLRAEFRFESADWRLRFGPGGQKVHKSFNLRLLHSTGVGVHFLRVSAPI